MNYITFDFVFDFHSILSHVKKEAGQAKIF